MVFLSLSFLLLRNLDIVLRLVFDGDDGGVSLCGGSGQRNVELAMREYRS